MLKPSKRVVICEAVTNQTKGGLHLASEGEKSKPELGKVIAIGQGVLPIELKVGDTIVYRRYTDNRVMVKGKEYNFIEFKDIMAVVG